MKNQYRGRFPKKGAWTVCQFKGAWQERAGSVFEGGLIPQCTLWVNGYKPNVSKSVILSISDSVTDEGRDLLKDILPKKMTRKLNVILLLLVRW